MKRNEDREIVLLQTCFESHYSRFWLLSEHELRPLRQKYTTILSPNSNLNNINFSSLKQYPERILYFRYMTPYKTILAKAKHKTVKENITQTISQFWNQFFFSWKRIKKRKWRKVPGNKNLKITNTKRFLQCIHCFVFYNRVFI